MHHTVTEKITLRYKDDLYLVLTGLLKKIPYPSVIALQGDIGAGKTQTAQFIAEIIGIKEAVLSPSFPIVLEYFGEKNLIHFDWYRIEKENELDRIGFDDYCTREAYILIEWADKFPHRIPDSAYCFQITKMDDDSRELIFSMWPYTNL